MPIQYRDTQDPQQYDPANSNPNKVATIDGVQYIVTWSNLDDLVKLQTEHETKLFKRALTAGEISAIKSAFSQLANQPTTFSEDNPTPADWAATQSHNFGTFGDYFGIFTEGTKRSADKIAELGKAPLDGLNKGLNTISLIAIAVLAYILVKG